MLRIPVDQGILGHHVKKIMMLNTSLVGDDRGSLQVTASMPADPGGVVGKHAIGDHGNRTSRHGETTLVAAPP
jgi:hypothetical protein